MTPAIDYGLTPDLRDYAMGLIAKPPEKTMKLSNGKYALDLSVDEDTYWGLVKLAAEIKTDYETYAENVLLGHVQSELDREAQD
jgi:hypothetical protein